MPEEAVYKPREVVPHGLTVQQFEVIVLLSLGWSINQTSKKIDVARSTISKWKKLDNFQLALQEFSNELVNENCARAHGLVARAMDGLGELMCSEEEDIRLRSCTAVMRQLGPALRERSPDVYAEWSDARLSAELERVQTAIMSSDTRRTANAEWKEIKDAEQTPTTLVNTWTPKGGGTPGDSEGKE